MALLADLGLPYALALLVLASIAFGFLLLVIKFIDFTENSNSFIYKIFYRNSKFRLSLLSAMVLIFILGVNFAFLRSWFQTRSDFRFALLPFLALTVIFDGLMFVVFWPWKNGESRGDDGK